MTNWRIGAAVILAAGAACGFKAHAQVDQAAEKVLKDSAGAIEKMHGVTYQSHLYGVGALKDIMDGDGEVKQLRIPDYTGKRQPVWIKGAVKELGKGKTPFQVSTYLETPPSGEIVDWIDDPQNTHYKRPITDRNDAQRVLSLGTQILMTEFTEPVPFAKQLKAQKIEMKPNEQVHGTDCQVVMVSWENGLRSELWWIGAEDHLPRKIEMAHGQNRDLAKGTEIWDVKMLDKADVAELALKTPPGYKDDFQAAVQTAQPKPFQNPQVVNPAVIPPPPVVGLPPGSAAPDFDLKSADGKSVKLGSLKGSVVVLTFGGSRFPKTEVVNGIVADTVGGGKNIQAYTLACREDSDQAAIAHAKSSKVPVLLGADVIRNDYKVVGFPFTYVLTPDGRVSKCFQGAVNKEQLQKAIDTASKNEVAEMPKETTSIMNPPGTVPAPMIRNTPKPAPAGATPSATPPKK